MLVTVEDVKELTTYTVTLSDIAVAQGIIEAFTGIAEVDINSAEDSAVLSRATAYQAAYVKENKDTLFSQAAITSISEGDSAMTLDVNLGAPYLAPLASFALRHLSGKGTRSVRTGSIFGRGPELTPWELN